MDKATKIELIRIRVATAHDNLADASWALRANHLRLAVDRAYFADFHIAAAALLQKGIARTRDRGVQSAFVKYFMNSKWIEPEFGKLLQEVSSLRDQAEHQLFLRQVTVDEATQAVADAERFVQRVEQYLKEVGAI